MDKISFMLECFQGRIIFLLVFMAIFLILCSKLKILPSHQKFHRIQNGGFLSGKLAEIELKIFVVQIILMKHL